MRIAHLSDPHFGTEQPPVRDALIRLIDEVAPDVVIVSGDITQRARRREFAAARAFLDRLAAPRLLVIPGNHDIPLFDLGARLINPYGGYRAALGRDLQPSLDGPGALIVTLNTTRWWRHSHGEIAPHQIELVAQRLTAARPEQLRIVVTHQPIAVTQARDRRHVLRGHAAAVRRWSEAGVDLLLGGHIHLPYAMQLGGDGTPWVVQAGTAVSSRIRDGIPNSVNVLHGPILSPDGSRRCALERFDYESINDRFHCATMKTLLLPQLEINGRAPMEPFAAPVLRR